MRERNRTRDLSNDRCQTIGRIPVRVGFPIDTGSNVQMS